MKPLISIIIPIYNCERYLARCLDSVFSQNYDNYEVICIDDGSTDNSCLIANNYKVKLYQQDNKGQGFARNKGIDKSKGEWICFVDADDTLNNNYLSTMASNIDENIDMIVCRINRIYDDGHKSIDKVKKYGVLNSKEALTNVNIGPTNKLIRKKIIYNCRFPEKKLRFEDLLFTPEIFINSNKIKVITEVLYNYYIREDSVMRRFDNSLDDIYTIIKELKNKYYYINNKKEIDYIIFKNGLFGHLSRIIYCDRNIINNELKKMSNFILSVIPDYWENDYIRDDKQLYFYVGVRLFKNGKLNLLIKPLQLLEKYVTR